MSRLRDVAGPPHRVPRARRRREPEHGVWTVVGMIIGGCAIAAVCWLVVAGRDPLPAQKGLISAVPGAVAFETAVSRTADLLGPFQPAGKAAEAGDPDTWDGDFVDAAVAPALAELDGVPPPAHLRTTVQAMQRTLLRLEAAIGSYQECSEDDDDECRTQRRALYDAVDDVYRTSGDLQLYTFG